MKIKILTILLCTCLLTGLLCLTGCGTNAPQQGQTDTKNTQADAIIVNGQNLIHQIIYSFLPDSDMPESTVLLNELRLTDQSQAKTWKQILLYWEETGKPGFTSLPAVYPKSVATSPADPLEPETIKLADPLGPETTEPGVTPEPETTEQAAPPDPETTNPAAAPEPVTERTFVITDDPLPEGLPKDNSLVIEILGFALMKDGSMREELIHRLETALSCAKQYPNAYVLVTGGGTAAEAPEATEADAMAAWLMEHGLSEDRLIIENRSKTTCENAVFSYEILRKDYPQINTMAIVSSDYHIPLGCLLFQSWFLLEADGNAPAISVAANACCLSGVYTFTLQEQAYWLENLTTYRQ